MALDRTKLAQLAQQSHFYKGKFRNLERTPAHGLRDLIRWQLDGNAGFPPSKRFPLQAPDPHKIHNPEAKPQLTWIGHSSFLFQFRGLNVLTDPVFSNRVSPVQFAGPKRHTPPALTLADLPDIHWVLISHNHYDHLDENTVVALHKRFGDQCRFMVPTGLTQWFRKRGITSVVELGWWQSHKLLSMDNDGAEYDVEFFCLPAQHFSGRGALDRNTSLWCSWLMDVDGYRLYFGGDTGYGDVFKQIGEIFSPIDLALLPIGAYAPRWFMSPVHVSPEDAVQIHKDIGSRQSIGMHWGTFILTDEPMDEPPRRLQQALQEQGVAEHSFKVMQHGELLQFPDNSPANGSSKQ